MITHTDSATPALETHAMHQARAGLVTQIRTLVRRNLTHIKRMPEMLMDVTIQPVMFVMLFAYVFGGSIQTGTDGGYRAWLLPGIMAQTMAFASFIVAIGLTNDLDKGIIDRLRALPINRAAVVIARSISSLIHSSIGIVIMSLTGLVVGWRIHSSLPEAMLGYALLLLWGFAMIWIGMFVGSAMRSVEAVQGVMFTTIFPITFLANTFAPTEAMPSVVRALAEWNPISALVQAMRELWGNAPAAGLDAALPLRHPVLASVLWSVGISVIVAPLAVRAFRNRTEKA